MLISADIITIENIKKFDELTARPIEELSKEILLIPALNFTVPVNVSFGFARLP